jgi:hypothetical protein
MVKNQSQTRKIRRNYFLTQRRYTYQESPKFEESQLILLRNWGSKNNGENENTEDYTKYYYRESKTFPKTKKQQKYHNYACESHKRFHKRL